jgi:hypothetical protein
MRAKAKQIRDRWSELRKLVNDWDPLGVVSSGAPADEYDCMSGPLLRRLEEHASVEDIAEYLTAELRDHFGVTVSDASAFARRVVSWHQAYALTGDAG